MESDKQLRQQLAKALDWREAHADLASAVADFPVEQRAAVPENMPHSAWQLLEHIRIALWDIVQFCQSTRHKSPPWPEGYWPKKPAPPSEEAWDQSIQAIKENIGMM